MSYIDPSGVRMSGPLSSYGVGLYAALTERGYASSSAIEHVRLLAHLSRWLDQRHLAAAELTPERVEEFLRVRRQYWVRWASERALAPTLGFLRGLGVIPPAPVPVATTPVEVLLGEYRRYLIAERGLVAGTVVQRERVARLFLAGLSEPIEEHLGRLGAGEVSAFVLRQCPGRSVSAARAVVSGTRSLLRFLHLDGRVPAGLAEAVPAVAGWSVSPLPRAVSPQLAARLVASCDPGTPVGRRDRAIMVLLSRLGLRAAEVAALRLADLDWRAGEVVVRGKGNRQDRLPLPADVGEALVGYLRHGRPTSSSRRVFLSVRAPVGELSPSAVRSVVRDGCRRAGIPRIGAHRLRHMVGTEALRAGASLAEVGQLLRQRSPLVTANYARVDRTALRGLARRWPGAGR